MRNVRYLAAIVIGLVAIAVVLGAFGLSAWCFVHGAHAAWRLYPDIAWQWFIDGIVGGLLGAGLFTALAGLAKELAGDL